MGRKTVKKIELGVCINAQHLTAHSFAHLLQPIKHLAQILSVKKERKKKKQKEGLERKPGRGWNYRKLVEEEIGRVGRRKMR